MNNVENTINTQTQLLNFINDHSTLSMVENESNFKQSQCNAKCVPKNMMRKEKDEIYPHVAWSRMCP